MTDVPEHLRERLWADLTCGSCGRHFTAEPYKVPCFQPPGKPNMPCCLACWDRRAVLRALAGLPDQGRPACYPSDYTEGT